MRLSDVIHRRENSLQPDQWFNATRRKMHKWSTKIRLWIRRAVNRVLLRNMRWDAYMMQTMFRRVQ